MGLPAGNHYVSPYGSRRVVGSPFTIGTWDDSITVCRNSGGYCYLCSALRDNAQRGVHGIGFYGKTIS